jgi:isoleucyl-tRNA synthetase
MMTLRNAINKNLELLRSEGRIKSSLMTELVLYVAESSYSKRDVLELISDDLRFLFLVSNVRIVNQYPVCEPRELISANQPYIFDADLGDGVGSIRVEIMLTTHAKCERCWHHREDVGSHVGHETICGRCVENVTGEGEVRSYA